MRALWTNAGIGLLLAFALCLNGGPANAQNDEAARQAREAQTRQKLDAIRAELKKLAEAQKESGAKKNDVVARLREQDVEIAATAKELRALDAKLDAQQNRLANLQTQREALDAKLQARREALAALLRAAYAAGRGEELKLLLTQDDPTRIGRLLQYLRYFQKARAAEIRNLLGDLDALAQVRASIDAQTADLQAARAQRLDQTHKLDAERAQRQQSLADIDRELADENARIRALGQDEKALTDLLATLREVFADIPDRLAGAEPFAQSRGRLDWPIRGRQLIGFGAHLDGDRTSNGILIAADEGSPVHAISHGRVVFADWMRGFGLLLILDHGDGYLSLYGYNQALLKDVGDWADANETIAVSGASGGQKATGVYFELRAQGKPVDPRVWLKP